MRRILFVLFLSFVIYLTGVAQSPSIFGDHVPQAGASLALIPNATVYLLDADNTIWMHRGRSSQVLRLTKLAFFLPNEVLIGIDFRVTTGLLYGYTDKGRVYAFTVSTPGLIVPFRLGAPSPVFPGGFQSLMDFNPVVDALRLIGSDGSNYALLGDALNQSVPQTRLSYVAGDVNAGATPYICGGAYSNNVRGAKTTILYAVDYDKDSLVKPLDGVNGSSATGAGVFQTLGELRTFEGNAFNVTPSADLDIFTDEQGNNFLLGISGRNLFSIDLSQVDSTPIVGARQRIIVRRTAVPQGGLIDIAIDPFN